MYQIPSMAIVLFSRQQGFPQAYFQLQSDVPEYKEVRLLGAHFWKVTMIFIMFVNSFQYFEAIIKQNYINRRVNCFSLE